MITKYIVKRKFFTGAGTDEEVEIEYESLSYTQMQVTDWLAKPDTKRVTVDIVEFVE